MTLQLDLGLGKLEHNSRGWTYHTRVDRRITTQGPSELPRALSRRDLIEPECTLCFQQRLTMFNVAANEFRVGTCAQLREQLFTLLPKQRSSSTTTAVVCELTQTTLEILRLVRARDSRTRARIHDKCIITTWWRNKRYFQILCIFK